MKLLPILQFTPARPKSGHILPLAWRINGAASPKYYQSNLEASKSKSRQSLRMLEFTIVRRTENGMDTIFADCLRTGVWLVFL